MESLITATAIACATMGGVFFTFSTFVMQALTRLPPAQGMAAMQSINIVAVTPVFMTALFGTAVACLAVAVSAVTDWRGESSAYLLAGSLTYVIGDDRGDDCLQRAVEQRPGRRRSGEWRRRRLMDELRANVDVVEPRSHAFRNCGGGIADAGAVDARVVTAVRRRRERSAAPSTARRPRTSRAPGALPSLPQARIPSARRERSSR